jgi:predicted acylesterase/phospholipase RssA
MNIPKSILFVRSGGGMPGLDIHCGIWRAMEAKGISPTHLSGTSAGAIICAMQAAGHSARFVSETIACLKDSDVRSERAFWKLRALWLDSYLDSRPIEDLLNKLCPTPTAEFAGKVLLWSTNCRTGRDVDLMNPHYNTSMPKAALASMSISGVFPPVNIGDDEYCDGGVRRNVPLLGSWRSFDEVYILIASPPPQDYPKRTGIITRLIQNIHYLMQDQIEDVLETCISDSRVTVIWPTVESRGGALHFDHELMHAAYAQTIVQLSKKEPTP